MTPAKLFINRILQNNFDLVLSWIIIFSPKRFKLHKFDHSLIGLTEILKFQAESCIIMKTSAANALNTNMAKKQFNKYLS